MKIGKYILGVLLFISIVSLIVIKNDNIFVDNMKNYHQKPYTVKNDIQTDEIVYDNFTVKIDDINKLINDDIVGCVYFGRDTCPECLEFNKYLQNQFNQNINLLVYKFDTDKWRSNENFKNILNKYNITKIPMLIKINNDKSYQIYEVDKVDNEKKAESDLNNFLNN